MSLTIEAQLDHVLAAPDYHFEAACSAGTLRAVLTALANNAHHDDIASLINRRLAAWDRAESRGEEHIANLRRRVLNLPRENTGD